MAGWTINPDTGLADLRTFCNEVRKAVSERIEVVGPVAQGSIPLADFDRLDTIPLNYFSDIDSKVSELSGHFVLKDYITDHPCRIHDVHSDSPSFINRFQNRGCTNQSPHPRLREALEPQEKDIVPPSDRLDLANPYDINGAWVSSWASQIYRKLNVLTDVIQYDVSAQSPAVIEGRQGSHAVSYAAAVASWNAAPWVSQPTGNPIQRLDFTGGGYRCTRVRSTITQVIPNAGKTYSWKFFVAFIPPGAASYANPDYPAVDHEYYLLDDSGGTTTSPNIVQTMGDFPTFNVPAAPASTFKGWLILNISKTVATYDIPGGFVYY